MTKRTPTTSPTAQDLQDRKVKLAEGGIILGLIVALCVFLGVHFAHDDQATVADNLMQPDTPPAMVDVVSAPAGAAQPAAATEDGTEPVAVVEPAAAQDDPVDAAAAEPLPLSDRLPAEVPIAVTYATSEVAFHEGRYAEAADMFAQYCDQHPGNAWGHYMLGLSLWKAGRDIDAVAAFEAALAQKPDHVKSLVNLARVQLELDRPEAALASVEMAIELAPASPDARRVLGRVYHSLGRLDEATATYRQALELNGDDAWALNNLALVWIEQEQFAAALPALARASELAPDAGVIRNNLGTALEASGRLNQAREQFELAANLGSARGEQSLARLQATTLDDRAAAVDLQDLAATWQLPATAAGLPEPSVVVEARAIDQD